MVRQRLQLLFAAAGLLLTANGPLAAQVSTRDAAPRYHWARYYSPATAISARIHAEADFLRAYGEATLDVAHAREVRARAVRQEISNSVEHVRAYWEKRSIHESERMKRYVAPLKRKEIQDSQTWMRLKDHPELNGHAIVQGNALNFLLNRLSGSVLAYQFSLSNPRLNPETISQLDLSTGTIHALQLRQVLASGQRLVFRADEGVPLQVDWWPYLLRDDAFAAQRKEFEAARRRMVEVAQSGSVDNKTSDRLLAALDALESKLGERHPREKRTRSVTAHQQYMAAKRFLQSLGGEILRVQTTGALAASGDLKFTGTNLVELLTYMSRHGLEFAAARPGDEAAYHSVFRMLRDLYITVADDGTKAGG